MWYLLILLHSIRDPPDPLPSLITVTTPPLYYFIIFIYSNTKNSITRVPGMEDNKNTHPPPKTRRAQVANACMKCRDAKLKVSILFFSFSFFFFSQIQNIKHYTIQTKRPKRKQEINVAHVIKNLFICYTVLLHSSRLRSVSRSETRVRVRRDRRHDEATTRSCGFAGFGRTVASEEDVVAIFTESED